MSISEEDRQIAEEGVAALSALCDELRSDFEGMKENLDSTVTEVVSDYAKVFERVLPSASPMHKSISLLAVAGFQDSDLSADNIGSGSIPTKPPLSVRVAIRHISMLQRAVAATLGIQLPNRVGDMRRGRMVITQRIPPRSTRPSARPDPAGGGRTEGALDTPRAPA